MRIKKHNFLFLRLGEIQPLLRNKLYYKVIIDIYNMPLTYLKIIAR